MNERVDKKKPIILAICGKAATGKDTLAKSLTNHFSILNLPIYRMISTTTRPPRIGEKNKQDYFFISKEQFKYLIKNQKLFEFTYFKQQYYGVCLSEIKKDSINIGVFNPQGLRTLRKFSYDYQIIPIYLEESFWLRMWRSYHREQKWKFEYIRRALTDYFDFKSINSLLMKFKNKYICLKNINSTKIQIDLIEQTLQSWGIFD